MSASATVHGVRCRTDWPTQEHCRRASWPSKRVPSTSVAVTTAPQCPCDSQAEACALRSWSVQQRIAELLHAERSGTCAPADLKLLAELWDAHHWTVTAPRTGLLMGRVPPQAGRCRGTTSCELASAGGQAVSSTSPPRRWSSKLTGGALPRCDFRTQAGRESALEHLRSRTPVVMAGAWELLPGAKRWSVEELQTHLAGAKKPCHVLKAKRDVSKYTYYFKDMADRVMTREAMEAVPCNEALNMSFEKFLRLARDDPDHSYYLQTSLFALDGSMAGNTKSYVTSDSLYAELQDAMASNTWKEVSRAIGGAPWIRSQLFVGPPGTLGFAHIDQYDNVFLQVRGSKRLLLFDPRSGARSLYPFPVHHPYDQRARVDLEMLNYTTFPRASELKLCGVEAVLRPGDAIFIPSHWWHHVESTSGSPSWCVSVNFWIDTVSQHLVHPPVPLQPHLEVELARQIEYIVADAFGPECVHDFMVGLASEGSRLPNSNPPDDGKYLELQNYILWNLARIFGPAEVCTFVDDFFDLGRWQNLQKICF